MREHGTRRTYQGGCACTPCRAAEAAYRAAYRLAVAKGQIPLGRHLPANQLWKLIKSLKVEGFTSAQIAVRCGLHTPQIQWHPESVTVKTLLKVRALYRKLMLEGDSTHG